MQDMLEIFKILSDESRLRLLMLLDRKELCVCQIMGILDISQPLISRNLSLLTRAGFLDDRREGKLMFYRIKKNLPRKHLHILSVLKEFLESDVILSKDMESLQDCTEFQKMTGKCDMETFKAFMEYKKKKNNRQGVFKKSARKDSYAKRRKPCISI